MKYNKLPQYRQNGHIIYQHRPLQDPPKFTQIWIFGLKICHLATLIQMSMAAKSLLIQQGANGSKQKSIKLLIKSSLKSKINFSAT
jgi:hypothetical protein